MAYAIPKPCKFQSLDSCQKRFLGTHEEVDLVPYPVVRLVPQVEDAEKFPQAPGFESLDPFLIFLIFFFRVSKQGPCFTTIQEDGCDKRLVQLGFAYEADGVLTPDPV